jgi:hypothetical protein
MRGQRAFGNNPGQRFGASAEFCNNSFRLDGMEDYNINNLMVNNSNICDDLVIIIIIINIIRGFW